MGTDGVASIAGDWRDSWGVWEEDFGLGLGVGLGTVGGASIAGDWRDSWGGEEDLGLGLGVDLGVDLGVGLGVGLGAGLGVVWVVFLGVCGC